MMMKFWCRKPEYQEETTDLRQVTDETFHTYGLCPVRGLNLGRSGVKQSELRRDESGAARDNIRDLTKDPPPPAPAGGGGASRVGLCGRGGC